MTPHDPPIEGRCDARFARVRDAFRANFADHDEIGAGATVLVGGVAVVDLWGGYRDAARTRPWQRDTLVNAYSVGKGITAIAVLQSVDRGELDLDAPVTGLWPEFESQGKGATTLRMMLAHRAGLPGVRAPLPPGAMLDWSTMTRELAAQRPFWTPGEEHGYHVNTYGFLVGELVRRRVGATIGRVLRDRIAGPLDADYHLGLAASEHHRVAETCAPGADQAVDPVLLARALDAEGDSDDAVMRRCTYLNPVDISGIGSVNTARWREAEIPSTNGHGTAQGVARIYDGFLRGGSGQPGGVGASLLAEATSTCSEGEDRILGKSSRFGLGFQLAQPTRPIGPNPRSFGHFGYGGSLGFADPDAGLAFGYVMNRPGERWQTPRVQALIDAVYEAL